MMLGREPLPVSRRGLFAGAAAIPIGAAGLFFGQGIAIRASDGTYAAGAAPMAYSAALMAFGVLLLLWGLRGARDLPEQPLGRAPATIAGSMLLLLLILVAVGAPYLFATIGWPPMDFVLGLGPPDIVALVLLIVTLWIVAIWLLPRGSLLRALGAAALGLLLATVGIDTITGVIRYTHELQLEAVHGLVLGFAAYRFGFNPVLIAVGYVYGDRLEESARQSLLISQGDFAVFADRPIGFWLLVAALGALALGAVLRFWQWRLARADVWGARR
jgi:TctA family transporter